MLPKCFSFLQLRTCFALLKNYKIPIFNAAMAIRLPFLYALCSIEIWFSFSQRRGLHHKPYIYIYIYIKIYLYIYIYKYIKISLYIYIYIYIYFVPFQYCIFIYNWIFVTCSPFWYICVKLGRAVNFLKYFVSIVFLIFLPKTLI